MQRLALAAVCLVALIGPAAQATVYTDAGFSFDLSPDIGTSAVNPNPFLLEYCPDCTSPPTVITITRPDNQTFDLLSMKIAGFSQTGWTLNAEAPLGTVLGTATVSIANGGLPGPTSPQSMDTGYVSTLYLVEDGAPFGEGVSISDLKFNLSGGSDTTAFSSVPEPASLLLLASGIVGIGLVLRRRTVLG